MGYKKKATVYKLKFEDPELDGLEVMAKSLPTGELLGLIRMAVSLKDEETTNLSEEDLATIEKLFQGFAKALVSWNLEDEDGKPVPSTLRGVQSQEFDFVLPIIMAWIQAVAGVDKDLGKDSNSGPSFPVPSIPMDVR